MPIKQKLEHTQTANQEIAAPTALSPETPLDNVDHEINFDTKSSEAIDTFGQALASSGLNAAFCVIFDETDNYKPKVFYRGDMFEITRHTSRILNQMRFKLIGELNGNF